MATEFSRTERSLARERPLLAWMMWGLALAALAGWTAWFFLGQVLLHEVSRTARLEVQQAVHPVTAVTDGKVLSHLVALGQEVRAGEVILQLDASTESLRLREEETRVAAFEPRLESIRRELAALQQAQSDEAQTSAAEAQAASARAREATVAADFAREQEKRVREESRQGGVSTVDALKAASESQKLAAARDVQLAELNRLKNDARSRASQRRAQIEALARTATALEGERDTARATLLRLQQDVERFVVRSPVDGVVGELLSLRPGSFVSAGQKVATVVPHGGLRVVADFAPAAALGRLRPGQTAVLKLDGFPWAEFGSVPVRVARVASEIREQGVRVELTLLAPTHPRIPLQHGLPGVVEVDVESVTPASLVLRRSLLPVSGRSVAGAAPGTP